MMIWGVVCLGGCSWSVSVDTPAPTSTGRNNSNSASGSAIETCLAAGYQVEKLSDGETSFNACIFPNGKYCAVESFAQDGCPMAVAVEEGPAEGSDPGETDADQPKMLLSTETIAAAEAVATEFAGQRLDADPWLTKYGSYAYQTLQDFPEVVTAIEQVKPDFDTMTLGTSFPSWVAAMEDNTKNLVLSGCTPHACGGSVVTAIYDPEAKIAYLLAEEEGRLVLYGTPPTPLRQLLFYAYSHKD